MNGYVPKIFPWTAEQVNTLKEMWGVHSSAIIAAKLGCSRNAVIGKAHRLQKQKLLHKLKLPPAITNHAPEARKDRVPTSPSGALVMKLPIQKSPPQVTLKKVHTRAELLAIEAQKRRSIGPIKVTPISDDTSGKGIPLIDLEPHLCHWVTSTKPPRYCGAATLDPTPYCLTHAKAVYTEQGFLRYTKGRAA
jgi:GcrA cell cycle regulator